MRETTDIHQLYNSIIEELKAGKRPRVEISQKRHERLKEYWKEVLKQNSSGPERPEKELLPVLCILDHAHHPNGEFHELIVETLNSFRENREDVLIHTLGVSRQHVINYSQLHGEPLSGEFIMAIKKLLKEQNDPEVLEWVLRLIESAGEQSLKFRTEILERRPGLMAIFNKHKKNARQIIQTLEKRWTSYGF